MSRTWVLVDDTDFNLATLLKNLDDTLESTDRIHAIWISDLPIGISMLHKVQQNISARATIGQACSDRALIAHFEELGVNKDLSVILDVNLPPIQSEISLAEEGDALRQFWIELTKDPSKQNIVVLYSIAQVSDLVDDIRKHSKQIYSANKKIGGDDPARRARQAREVIDCVREFAERTRVTPLERLWWTAVKAEPVWFAAVGPYPVPHSAGELDASQFARAVNGVFGFDIIECPPDEPVRSPLPLVTMHRALKTICGEDFESGRNLPGPLGLLLVILLAHYSATKQYLGHDKLYFENETLDALKDVRFLGKLSSDHTKAILREIYGFFVRILERDPKHETRLVLARVELFSNRIELFFEPSLRLLRNKIQTSLELDNGIVFAPDDKEPTKNHVWVKLQDPTHNATGAFVRMHHLLLGQPGRLHIDEELIRILGW